MAYFGRDIARIVDGLGNLRLGQLAKTAAKAMNRHPHRSFVHAQFAGGIGLRLARAFSGQPRFQGFKLAQGAALFALPFQDSKGALQNVQRPLAVIDGVGRQRGWVGNLWAE